MGLTQPEINVPGWWRLSEYEVHSHEFPSVTAAVMNMGGVAACSSQFGLFSTGRKSQRDAQLILLHTPLRFPYRQRPAEPIRHALPRTKLSFRALGINRHLGIQKHAVARPSILVWFGPGDYTGIE